MAKRRDMAIGARVSKELYERIKEYTDIEEVSMGTLIRRAVKTHIEAYPPKKRNGANL
jgi:predicted DNA-binding protein